MAAIKKATLNYMWSRWRLQLTLIDRAADSAKWMEWCAHCTHHSTMPTHELANHWEGTIAT